VRAVMMAREIGGGDVVAIGMAAMMPRLQIACLVGVVRSMVTAGM
jgi:hypothetical protein